MTSYNDGTGRGPEAPRHTFAIVSTWPDTKNAEFEVLERLLAAARNVGATALVIDDDGYILSASGPSRVRKGERISSDSCEFVVSLHFQSPRLYDVHSYVTLWNPPDFYHDFGYRPSTEKLASHSDFLSCHSDLADAHAANLMDGLGRSVPRPFATLFHSLPEPFLKPRIDARSKLFYIGINWEKISGTRGRHQELLEQLDREDLVNIYGPEEFYGVKPWEGFRNYCGSIPFDGRSVLVELNKAGICLAFSSLTHQQSGIMSNRLFEGLAAGAVLIANPHPFIDKYFADCVHVVEDTDPSRTAKEVRAIVEGIRRDPTEAIERAERGQARLRERFSLEFCLNALFDGHPARVAACAPSLDPPVAVSVVLLCDGDGEDLEAMRANAARQRGVRIDLVVVCDRDQYRRHAAGFEAGFRSVRIVELAGASRSGRRGALVADVLAQLTSAHVCFMETGEEWFSNHLASLVECLHRSAESSFACAGRIVEDVVPPNRYRRRLETLGFEEFAEVVTAVYPGDAGRFLFRTDALRRMPASLLPLLHGCETRALRLWALLQGELALSNSASFVQRQSSDEVPRLDAIPEERQVDYILDSVRGNPLWTRLRAELVCDRTPRRAGPPRIDLDRMYHTRLGQDGPALLRSGFSAIESSFTWIDGPVASLEFELASGGDDAVLVLMASGRNAYGTDEPQRLTVRANGRTLIEDVPVPEQGTEIRALLPSDGRTQPRRIRLTLRLNHAEQVRGEEGQVVDPRYLGMQLSAVGLFREKLPRFELDRLYEFRAGGDGVPALGWGFSQPEDYFTWIDGTTAEMGFELPAGLGRTELMLIAGGPAERGSAEPQRLTILMDGRPILEGAELRESAEGLTLTLPPADPDKVRKVRLTLQIAHAEQYRAPDGSFPDPRRLGIHLVSMRLSASDAPTIDREAV